MRKKHRKYMEKIERLAKSEPGGQFAMDGTPIKRNCVQEAIEAAIHRRYGTKPKRQ